MKKEIISLSIIALLTICMFNSVAAAHVTKHSTDAQIEKTYLTAYVGDAYHPKDTAVTVKVGQEVGFGGVFSVGGPVGPPGSEFDHSYGIPYKTVILERMNPDGKTWRYYGALGTMSGSSQGEWGRSIIYDTPGVYTYRATFHGIEDLPAPPDAIVAGYGSAVSNAVTITVTT